MIKYDPNTGQPIGEKLIRDEDGKRVNAPPKEQTGKSDEVSQEVKVPFGKAGKFFQDAINRAREVAPKVANAYN